MATPRKDPKDYLKRGRPSSYRPEYAQMLIEYFSRPAWDITRPDGTVEEGYFPTLAGFCWEIGVTKITVRQWAEAKDLDDTPLYPEFASAYNQVKERQEQIFSVGYMRGKYFNPAIGALIAKNIMDWRDKQEVAQTVQATVDQTVNVTSGLAERLAKLKAEPIK